MSDKTKIEWTDATWNPLVGCSRVSAGCINCYAERHAYRFARLPGTVYEGTARLVNGRPTFTGRVNFNERVLDAPLRWKRPRRIFVNSMSDLFHESVPDETIDSIFAVMALAPQHTFQVLTKRPARMRAYFARELLAESWWEAGDRMACEIRMSEFHAGDVYLSAVKGKTPIPLPNVWLGVSVEDQVAADERIPLLLKTPAAVRFLSCEPLLGPIDLLSIPAPVDTHGAINMVRTDVLHASTWSNGAAGNVDWVIAGGESGPRARPMHPDWARSLRDQCAAAGVPFFFKQWGEYREFDDGSTEIREIADASEEADDWVAMAEHPSWLTKDGRHITDREALPLDAPCRLLEHVGKRAAGRSLDGVQHNDFPAVHLTEARS